MHRRKLLRFFGFAPAAEAFAAVGYRDPSPELRFSEFRGLFIEDTERKRRLADWQVIARDVAAKGYTDVFVATTYVGGAHYDSDLPGLVRWSSSMDGNGGTDVPAAAVAAFAPLGLRIHAVIIAFNARYGVTPETLQALRERSLLGQLYHPQDHRRAELVPWGGAMQRWLNYNHPDARSRLASIARELVTKYPMLAGIHLDYIRSPGWVAELSDATLELYGADDWRRLLPGFFGGDDSSRGRFDAWQRSNVSDAVRRVSEAIGSRMLSASVFTADASPEDHHQSWNTWGVHCAFVSPMIYKADFASFEHQLHANRQHAAPGQHLTPVIGLHQMPVVEAVEARELAGQYIDYRLSYL